MSALHAAIAQRFCQPEWATFFEVRDATGFAGQGRSADAVAMNCYPSRGLEVHGFEVKSARGDFLRELKSPAKSVAVQKYCDRWWIVATAEVVKELDLFPPTWGLMVLTGGALRIVTQAPKLDAVPIDRHFMAAMFRAAAKHSESALPALLEAEKKRLKDEVDDRVAKRVQYMREQGAEAIKLLEKIKAETGLDLATYRMSGGILQAIKFALAAELHGYDALASLVRGAKVVLKAAEEAKVYGIELGQ